MKNELPSLAQPQKEAALSAMGASAQAVVQRTLAEVQVAVMMAKQFPRDKIASIDKLKNDCCREKLAKEATYCYQRGGNDITGPTIRLAEAAKNAWGNMQSGWRELSRINGVSEIEAFAWDSENNTRETVTFSVKHWRDTKQGGYAIKDERDIAEMCANQAKRRERACILNLIDGDVIEAALTQCDETLEANIQITPEYIKEILKGFEKFKVTKEQIEKRIQRRIDAINPPLVLSLNKIYNSMKDGMSKSEDWFDAPELVAGDEKPKAKATVAKKETVQTTEQSSAVETTTATSATESEIPPVLSTKPPKPRAFGVYDSNGDQYIGGELEMCAQEVCVQLEGMKITERPDYITHNNEVIEAAASESSPFCKRLTQFIKTAK